MSKRAEENKSRLYGFCGSETLGSCLRVQRCSDNAPQVSDCSIQWYRLSQDESRKEIISGNNPFFFFLLNLSTLVLFVTR